MTCVSSNQQEEKELKEWKDKNDILLYGVDNVPSLHTTILLGIQVSL